MSWDADLSAGNCTKKGHCFASRRQKRFESRYNHLFIFHPHGIESYFIQEKTKV
ncbi:hypothetical protein FB480_104123 [Agrobacterium vitis]|nr:hypothetical protein FB480_104123 [Agrobacterium vitis]